MRFSRRRWDRALALSVRQKGLRRERGFTVIEMLIATTIMMAVTAATFGLMDPAQGTFAAQPEASDMQQRLRIGVETLYKDLLMAGAGPYTSSVGFGSLVNFFATVYPARLGSVNPDPPGTFKTDRLTLMYVPQTSAQTTLEKEKKPDHPHLHVNKIPGCPKNSDFCGFEDGMHVMIFDDTGAYDTFYVTGDGGDNGKKIQKKGQALDKTFPAGSYVAQFYTHTYYLSTDTVAETYQLRYYDGFETDVPIVENVVGLEFELFGQPLPPQLLKPVTDPAGPWTTYGPKPPGLAVDNVQDSWPAGENCAFMVVDGQQVPRMETLGAANGPLVKLDQARLTDGPWCPDAVFNDRYDADLLRVRKIRVTLRIQVANKALRGAAGTLFTRAGTSRGGEKFIPDQQIKFDVTPRNLNLGR